MINLQVSRAARAARLLLRARPVQPADLLDRRQRGGELRRRALPEVRLHHQPRDRRSSSSRPTASVVRLGGRAPDAARLRPARRVRRLGGHPRHRHRGDRAADPRCPRRCARCSPPSTRTDEAGGAVSAIIAAGVVPAAIEMMDALAIEAAEAAVHCGYPDGAGAVLIVELDGPARRGRGAVRPRSSGSAATTARSRSGSPPTTPSGRCSGRAASRRSPRSGRISPDYIVQDGVIPRTALPEVLRRIAELSAERRRPGRQRLPRRRRQPAPAGAVRRRRRRRRPSAAEEVSGAILDLCVEHGGSITGEHGVGVDKAKYMPRMFTDDDLDTMQLLRCAFDPRRAVQPGQGLPDPAAVRRGARPAQGVAPAAGGRPGGGVLRWPPTPSSTDLQTPSPETPRWTAAERDTVAGVPARYVAAPRDHRRRSPAAAAARPPPTSTWRSRSAAAARSWTGARPPTPAATCSLDTTALTGVVEHAAGDLVVVVRAGTPLGALRTTAGRRRPAARPRRAAARRHDRRDASPPAPAGRAGCSTAPPATCSSASPSSAPTASSRRPAARSSRTSPATTWASWSPARTARSGLITEAAFRLHPLPAAAAYVTAPCRRRCRRRPRRRPAVLGSQLVPAAVEVDATPRHGAVHGDRAGRGHRGRRRRPRPTRPDGLLGDGADRLGRACPTAFGALPVRHDGGTGLKVTCVADRRRRGCWPTPGRLAEPARPAGRGCAARRRGVLHAGLPGTDPTAVAAALVAAAGGRRGRGRHADGARPRRPAVRDRVDLWGPVAGLDADAPGQAELRPGRPARARPIRRRHLMRCDQPDARPHGASARRADSPPADRATCRPEPAPGGAFDAHHPPSAALARRLRALRLLPADLPDLRAVGRGDGLARAGGST